MKSNGLFFGLFLSLFLLSACGEDDAEPSIDVPTTYAFSRDGASTISFGGQTTRIAMAEELISALLDQTQSKTALLAMFAHEEGAEDFSDSELNASSKSVRSKSAASTDFFSSNATDAAVIKTQFDTWILKQHDEVFPKWNSAAAEGTAGQIADGSSTRYVSADGVEYNQVVAKSLIGAMMTDQILNNYLSSAVLDEGTNQSDNDADVLADGENYTTMEHKWDEAFGYAYGASAAPENPNATIGEDDSFLNKYIGSVNSNANYEGIAAEIFDAFKLGRAAIVAKNYTVRNEQAELLRELISKVIAIRAIHYLQAGKDALASQSYGGAFHDLSEGLGFVYSLQFTRMPNTDQPYFTKEEVDGFMDDILGGTNGLWTVSANTLDEVSNTIAAGFGLELVQAAE